MDKVFETNMMAMGVLFYESLVHLSYRIPVRDVLRDLDDIVAEARRGPLVK